jgi:hypothetical protein
MTKKTDYAYNIQAYFYCLWFLCYVLSDQVASLGSHKKQSILKRLPLPFRSNEHLLSENKCFFNLRLHCSKKELSDLQTPVKCRCTDSQSHVFLHSAADELCMLHHPLAQHQSHYASLHPVLNTLQYPVDLVTRHIYQLIKTNHWRRNIQTD